MSALRRESVQLHCRTCLCDLQTKVDEIGLPRRWYHLQTTDELAEWIKNLTSLQVLAAGPNYPQFVCEECYEKLKDYQEFRRAILDSAAKLDAVLKTETASRDTLEKPIFADGYIKSELHYDEEGEELNDFLNKDGGKSATPSCEVIIPERLDNFDSESNNQDAESLVNSNESVNNEGQLNGDGASVPDTHKPFKCEHCDRCYSHKYTYIAHIRQNHQGISHAFECENCHKKYTNSYNLHRHMRIEHNTGFRQFQCEYPDCNRSFRHLTTRRRHYQEFHQRMKRPPTPPTPPDSTLLLPELLLATDIPPPPPKRFTCALCNEQFETLYNLQSHMDNHRDDMKFVCNICGKRKISQVKLDEHYATVHDPKNAYPCNICHKVFKCKSHVSVHIMSVHKGLRPFGCHYCSMRFAAKNTLKIHERLHTGEKPFACEVCGRRFTQLTPMKKHRLIHDKEIDPRYQQSQQMADQTPMFGFTAFGN